MYCLLNDVGATELTLRKSERNFGGVVPHEHRINTVFGNTNNLGCFSEEHPSLRVLLGIAADPIHQWLVAGFDSRQNSSVRADSFGPG